MMSLLSPSPDGALKDNDYGKKSKKTVRKKNITTATASIKKTQKKKRITTATATTTTTATANSNAQPLPAGGDKKRMTLRDSTQRRRPNRYCELQEIPDTKPAWLHPPVAFNADLARFTRGPSLPMDYPWESPSRVRYWTWLAKKERRRAAAEQGEEEAIDVNPRAAVSSRFCNGPGIAHLPPLPKRWRGQQWQPLADGEGGRRTGAGDGVETGGLLAEEASSPGNQPKVSTSAHVPLLYGNFSILLPLSQLLEYNHHSQQRH